MISFHNFQMAIWHFVESGLILPYGVLPGWFNGGIVNIGANEAFYNWYRWNPPMFTGHREPDPNASPKPKYPYLLELSEIVLLNNTQEEVKERINEECIKRILSLHDVPDERYLPLFQLTKETTGEQREKTSDLMFHDKFLGAGILDLSQAELEKFDPSSDIHWTEIV